MRGAIFMEMLRRNWRSTLYWGIGMGLYGFLIAVFIQDADVLKQYGELIKAPMMETMIKALGLKDSAALATPEGFIGYGFSVYALVILAVYGVIAGLSITASEEDQGIMDVLLSLPVARWRIIVEKLSFYTVSVVVIAACAFIGLWSGVQLSPVMKVDTGKLLASTIDLIPSTLLVIGFTAFVATLVRRKGLATAIAALFVVGSWVVNFIANMASGSSIAQLNGLSFFYYYDGSGVMVNGLVLGNVILLLVIAVLLAGGTLWGFERRDVGL